MARMRTACRRGLAACLALLLAALWAAPARAANGAAGWTSETYDVDNGGTVEILVGEERDLNGFIRRRREDREWSLVGGLTWSSSDPHVASVGSDGVVTGVRNGAAKITATGWDNRAEKLTVTIAIGVKNPGNAGEGVGEDSGIDRGSITVREGRSVDIQALFFPAGAPEGTAWESSNASVAKVDGAGTVYAAGIGKGNISAYYTDEGGAPQRLRIEIKVRSIQLDEKTAPAALILREGATVDLVQVLYPHYAQLPGALRELDFAAGSSGVVTVSGSKVTARKAGASYVTITDDISQNDPPKRKIEIQVIA